MMTSLRFFSFCSLFIFLSFSGSLFSQPALQWAKPVGGAGAGDAAESVVLDQNGNVYLAGVFEGTVDFDPGPGISNLTSNGSDDIYILKLNSVGAFVWAKNFGSSTTTDRPTTITIDRAGNIYTTGFFWGTVDFDPGTAVANLASAGDFDVFVLKLDPEGNYVWAKNMGGPGRDAANSMVVDVQGNVYTTGAFVGAADFDPGADTNILVSKTQWTDVFISKLNSSGDFVWAKSIGGAWYDFGRSIALDGNGNIVVAGDFYDDIVDFDPGPAITALDARGKISDIFVSKFDAAGSLIWARQMGGDDYDNGYAVTVDNSGNVLTTGYFSSSADFDPGSATFDLSAGNIFVSKLNSAGNFEWAKEFQGIGGGFFGNVGSSIATDNNRNVFVVGSFARTLDFDPGPAVFNLNSEGIDDVFLAELDGGGNFMCAGRIGSAEVDKANSVAVLDGNVFCAGFFAEAVDFDQGIDTFNVAGQLRDGFVAKYASCLSVGIKENEMTEPVVASPNPNNGSFILEFTAPVRSARLEIKIFNSVGQEVYRSAPESAGNSFRKTVELDEHLPNGIYFLRVISENKISESKIVLMK